MAALLVDMASRPSVAEFQAKTVAVLDMRYLREISRLGFTRMTNPPSDAVQPERTKERYPSVVGKCPACGWRGLFIGVSGYVTCSQIECPNPGAASDLLERGDLWG